MNRKYFFFNLATILLFIGLILAGLFVENLNNERHIAATRAAAQNYLALMRTQLESNIKGDFLLVKGLVSVVAANPSLTQKDFVRAAKPLFQEGFHLRSLSAAPGMVISMIYPVSGNEKALGLDFRKNPDQFEAIERSRLTRQIVVAGPLQLVQGGLGLLSREPVFIKDEQGHEYYWGHISSVINADQLFLDSGLVASNAQFDIAIRGRNATGGQGGVFFGDAKIFSQHPELVDIPLPQGSWQMGAVPHGGWPSYAQNAWQVRISFLLVALLLLLPFFALSRTLHAAFVAQVCEAAMKAQLSATLENNPNVAVQWYDNQGRVAYWNKASELIYGWSAEEAVGKSLGQLIFTESEAREFLGLLKSSYVSGKTYGPMEYICRHRDGREKIVASTIFAIPGVPSPIIARMDIDVTERKQAEKSAQLAKDAAETANRAKSDFLACMSHEFRTPLNSIIGFAQMLEMDDLKPLSEDQKEAVDYILSSSQHLRMLVNDVLDLASIENGGLNIHLDVFPLKSLLEEAIAFFRPVVTERQITVQQSCQDAFHVKADLPRLRQVVLNLLSNAIKYNRDGGYVKVSCAKMGGGVRITIADTGTGIAVKHWPDMFQPFQRLGAEKSNIEGTGIGLVLSKRLVEAMHGTIGFDSVEGIGSRFWIDLPLLIDKKPQKSTSRMLQEKIPSNVIGVGLARKRVLYFEDNAININVMRHVFRKLYEAELLIAETTEAGLALLSNSHIDLILMDISVSGVSGLKNLTSLKCDVTNVYIPVIVISESAIPVDISLSMEPVFAVHMAKPHDVLNLVHLIRKTLLNEV